MAMWLCALLPLLCFAVPTVTATTLIDFDSKPPVWRLFGQCSEPLEPYIEAAADFVQCALNYSVPPTMCTNCPWAWAAMERSYHTLQTNNGTTSHGYACNDVIFNGYLLSYAAAMHSAAVEQLWRPSRCECCVTVDADNETVALNDNFMEYSAHLVALNTCLYNTTGSSIFAPSNQSQLLCDECWRAYSDLYDFYWNHFVEDEVPFCLDIESTMNDTIFYWRNILKCDKPTTPERLEQIVSTSLCTVAVLGLLVAFYVGNFVAGERRAKMLKKYGPARTRSYTTLGQTPHAAAVYDNAALSESTDHLYSESGAGSPYADGPQQLGAEPHLASGRHVRSETIHEHEHEADEQAAGSSAGGSSVCVAGGGGGDPQESGAEHAAQVIERF